MFWGTLQINKTLASVVNGCFNNKDAHSVGFVVRWLNEHCHRLIFPVHRCDTAFRLRALQLAALVELFRWRLQLFATEYLNTFTV